MTHTLASGEIKEMRFVYRRWRDMLEIHDKEMVDLGSGAEVWAGNEFAGTTLGLHPPNMSCQKIN